MNDIEAIDVTEVARPVRRAKKPQKTGDAFVGKDILELLGVSMYVEPLTMYREYVQNATDAIDQAIVGGLLSDTSSSEIRVTISQSNRSVIISDNGQGIPSRKFSKIMLAFGASEKRGTDARGFRGVGRFSGLGYCQQLVFRTKAASERIVSEVEWDGRLLKRLLADNTEQLSIADLVKQVAVFSQYESDATESHFFEVELKSVVRMGNDSLLNEETVKKYISQVCPVPYSQDFDFKGELEDLLTKYGIACGYKILVKDDYSDEAHIHRPYKNSFFLTETQSDIVSSVDIFEIEGVHGGISAIGWVFQHNYKGIIPSSSSIRGIRVRAGNTQIGSESLMTDSFAEPRFNSWSMGEIHVLERKITPNGRRDNFDTNVHWLELQNQFSQHAKSIAKICRRNSSQRNAIKQFNAEIQRSEQYKNVLASGVLSKSKTREVRESLVQSLLKAENLAAAKQLDNEVKIELANIVKKHSHVASKEKLKRESINDIFEIIPQNKVATVREIFDFIFECSPNKVVAQLLIDKIVNQYKAKYS